MEVQINRIRNVFKQKFKWSAGQHQTSSSCGDSSCILTFKEFRISDNQQLYSIFLLCCYLRLLIAISS